MIAVIDVCGNNLASFTNALKRLGYHYKLTHEANDLLTATHVILPGVGTAAAAMRALKHYQLIDVLCQLTQPVLGICLGMQLLLEFSEEGNVDCLKQIPGYAKRFVPLPDYPVPHMGWSKLVWTQQTPLARGLTAEDYVYFVHSYALPCSSHAVANCHYSEEFTAIVQHDNYYGMQFHPEKSAATGLKLLNNFLQLEKL
ncbi:MULTISPECIES: imidazole glycerol phosphate synthase subunit HisH [Legionella]|uniref:Imidazole glycerol phosphate synthase subunit HisH n=1 Tax=Legionella maceachernii TaxID=466 RepID=A0A0W0VYZ6_9GAMM|nr:imidazole glycerol phosphate synthase subunit HisH [Legionella maceachernii]KTD25229.1 imidazole glycerol phosphate synthase subunit HisH [Legionella maceachernii]SJZ76870.1 glutamine amidotransferase [Legionella maceachernii]SUP03077.1 Imidazole glycerol phosphate synthase subunit HisH [Legionella maceachernii]